VTKTIELLESIRDSAVDANSNISTILRKCKVLAVELDSKLLEEWVLHESNGYPEDAKVPDYRVCTLELKGHFFGGWGASMTNVLVPMSSLPKGTRESYERFKCRQSVASIEKLLSETKNGTIRVTTKDLAVALGTNVYPNYNCMEVWAEISANWLTEVLNSVRNRILDFSLAIGKEAIISGTSEVKEMKKMEDGKLTQIFNTTVIHGSANIVGTATNSHIEFNITINDLDALREVLLKNGISKEDFNGLQKSLEEEKILTTDKGFGPKVSTWISKMMEKAAKGIWEIGLGAAGDLLARTIGKYYGL
jgi:hypothetical protein